MIIDYQGSYFVNHLTFSKEVNESQIRIHVSHAFYRDDEDGQRSWYRTMTGQVCTITLLHWKGVVRGEYSYATGNERLASEIHYYPDPRKKPPLDRGKKWVIRTMMRLFRRFLLDYSLTEDPEKTKQIRAFVKETLTALT